MINLPMAPLVSQEPMDGEERQMTRGIAGCHNEINKLAEQIFNAASHLAAVTNVLRARGLLSEEEVAAERQAEQQRLATLFQERQIGVQIDSKVPDKYAVPQDQLPAIDCENRYHLCHAACCALRFPLSMQDLEEGIVRWELAEPYRNRIGPDEWCVHLDRGTHRCSIYRHRPGICRTYDCRKDSRIWEDFDKMIINPELYTQGEDGRWRFHFRARPAEEPAAPAPEAVARP